MDTSPRWPTSWYSAGGDHAFHDRQDRRFFLVEVLVESRRELFQQRGECRAGGRGGCVLPRGERMSRRPRAAPRGPDAGCPCGRADRRGTGSASTASARAVRPRPGGGDAACRGLRGHARPRCGPGRRRRRLPPRRVGAAGRIRGGTCGARSPCRWCRTAFARRSARSRRPRPPRRWAARGPSRGARRGCARATARCSRARGRGPARCVTSSSSVSPVMTAPDGPQVRLILMAMLLL